jgi:hypothetical protein
MFHMLTCFNLKPGVDINSFRASLSGFVDYLHHQELVDAIGPVGCRQSDTRMDTDRERDHQYYVIMSFRDRAQADAAYAHLAPHEEPAEAAHKAVYQKVRDPIFICWQDMD